MTQACRCITTKVGSIAKRGPILVAGVWCVAMLYMDHEVVKQSHWRPGTFGDAAAATVRSTALHAGVQPMLWRPEASPFSPIQSKKLLFHDQERSIRSGRYSFRA